jgi:hypothetical protein
MARGSRLWWDLIKQSGGLQWLLTNPRSYVRDSDPQYWEAGRPSEVYNGANAIRRTESEEHKALYSRSGGATE